MFNPLRSIINWFVVRQEFDRSEHPKPLQMYMTAIGRLQLTLHWGTYSFAKRLPFIEIRRNKPPLTPGFVVYFLTLRKRDPGFGWKQERLGVRFHWMNADYHQRWVKEQTRKHSRTVAVECPSCGRLHPFKGWDE